MSGLWCLNGWFVVFEWVVFGCLNGWFVEV